MPLWVLLPIVIVGIAGIGVLLHLTGHSRVFVLRDDASVRRQWARHWPSVAVTQVDLAGGAALVLAEFGPALLRPFGADTVAHRITAMDLAPQGLRLHFGDLAAPPVTLHLDPDARDRWLTLWRGAHA